MSNISTQTLSYERTSSLQMQYSQGVAAGARAGEVAGAEGGGKAASATAVAREEQNMRILQASAEVSLKAGDQSQALLFRTAIDRINELLAPELGPDAIQAKMGEDNSPEATAGRIVSLSTGFFDAYAAQHPGEDPNEVAKNFVDLIRGGFEKGFNEAKDILQGLKVFGGDIESGVMKTYELVSKGYDDFLASKLAPAAEDKAATEVPA